MNEHKGVIFPGNTQELQKRSLGTSEKPLDLLKCVGQLDFDLQGKSPANAWVPIPCLLPHRGKHKVFMTLS